MSSPAPEKLRSGNASRKPFMKAFTSSRPRRGACNEYCSRIFGAASSSMIAGSHGLPQKPVNHRPTTALLLVSFDMMLPPLIDGLTARPRVAFSHDSRGSLKSWRLTRHQIVAVGEIRVAQGLVRRRRATEKVPAPCTINV